MIKVSFKHYSLLVAALCLLGVACSTTVSFTENIEDYRDEIRRLEARLVQNPDDAEALRDLGVIYAQSRLPNQAIEYLQNAYTRDNNDPKTMFYLAHTLEVLGQYDTSMRVLERYDDIPRTSTYRKLVQGRYNWRVREATQQQVRNLVALEDSIATSTSPVSDRIIAVYPLVYQGQDERYEPLSRGVSEMIISDLGLIDRLRLVERVEVQLLLDELALGETAFVDPSTRPRTGRLLSAGRLVGGTYNVASDRDLNLDLSFVDVETNVPSEPLSDSDALPNLFDLQKRMVFSLLAAMNIPLTPEERNQIELNVPTRNLQSFLAYSRGLQEEDRGNFGAAAGFYQQAVQIDPTFQSASTKAESAESVTIGGGTTEDVLVAAAGLESIGTPTLDLMEGRIRNMNSSLSGGFVPGQDSRNPVQEVPTTLPEPPRPPGNQ